MSGSRVEALRLWVEDLDRATGFYTTMLGIEPEGKGVRLPDGMLWELCAGRKSCAARGPHGIVPALHVEDIAEAKAWVRRQGYPLLFEEVVPGLARITTMDTEGNPIDLVQELDASEWHRGMRIPEGKGAHPPRVYGLFELSLYARDTGRALHFFRDILGLEPGLAYFAHVHLLFENVPLVIRPTWRQCDVTEQHTPALVLDGGIPTAGWEACVQEGYTRGEHIRVCGQVCRGCFDGEHTWVYVCM